MKSEFPIRCLSDFKAYYAYHSLSSRVYLGLKLPENIRRYGWYSLVPRPPHSFCRLQSLATRLWLAGSTVGWYSLVPRPPHSFYHLQSLATRLWLAGSTVGWHSLVPRPPHSFYHLQSLATRLWLAGSTVCVVHFHC